MSDPVEPTIHPDDRSTAACRIETLAGGETAWITLSHPGKMNAIGSAMMRDVTAIFDDLAARDSLRVVVITGEGDRAFIGGAFLPELYALTPDGSRAFITRLHVMQNAARVCPVPVIARIQGYCVGAGAELAAACDFRVGDDTAVVGMPEVKVGMASIIEAALLPSIIGWGKAREMLMTGANYPADEAKAMGFLETLAPAGELDRVVAEKIDQIYAAGPRAVREQKRLINAWQDMTPTAAVASSIDAMADAYASGEPQRMIAPLLKREPS